MKRTASTTFPKGWKEDPPGEFERLMSMKWPKRMRDESDEEIEEADEDERPLKSTLSGHSMHGDGSLTEKEPLKGDISASSSQSKAPLIHATPSEDSFTSDKAPTGRFLSEWVRKNGSRVKPGIDSDEDQSSDDADSFHGSQSETSSSKVIVKKEATSNDDALSGQKNSRDLQPVLPKAGAQKHEADVNASDDEVLPHGGAREEPLRLLSKAKGKCPERRIRRCGYCQKPGHYATTCPVKGESQKASMSLSRSLRHSTASENFDEDEPESE
ncbi:hypothetical protein IW261DRAFT_1573553 [Armillaria novae-zelandiae]|uniref:CCHC-type domain-containing protein n=1 Tax=Armillaria novae-zelandiae TaxID=153914 RepID=A0AA39T6W3_9AGAR|nr:hypothetical protein IW261DRAFT_1573553 [Armillaria novae-zelandiae]